jgi:uncharacterized membrane protein YphA (DoxX/SURF4 family)
MNALTRVFLVLLRIAIGWHFLVEGIDKIQSVNLGPTETNRPWTSEPYLREASGPLGDFFRRQIGDLDDAALERLTLLPLPPGADPGLTQPESRFPTALGKEWDDNFARFVAHYKESADPWFANLADAKLKQSKSNTVQWLLHGKKRVKREFPSGSIEIEKTTPERIAEYQAALQQVRDMLNKELPAFQQDVLKDKLRLAKAQVSRYRNELMQDLAAQTADMKAGLRQVTQKDLLIDSVNAYVSMAAANQPASAVSVSTYFVIGPKLPAADAALEPSVTRPVDRIDLITRYGLTAVGVCLILGLFTRTACLGGAAFLLMFYLTMPPFPGVPENLRAEGHYLFVNKNLIEMLALLALATTRSGCWAGLDGILCFLNPLRWRARHDDHALSDGRARHH